MVLKRVLWLGLLGVGLSTSMTTAQGTIEESTPGSFVAVQAWEGRPGAFGPREGFVEIRNTGPLYMRVEVRRTFRNPEPYTSCTGCTTPGCGEGPSTICSLTNTNILELGPCGVAETSSCKSTPVECMPNRPGGHSPCDSPVSGPEFCAYYEALLVRVIGTRSSESEPWTATDDEVCATWLGRGSPPWVLTQSGVGACPVTSYCDRHVSLTPCSPSGTICQ